MMRYLRQGKVLALVLALFCAATLQADSLMLTSAPTGIIGPYVATINGTPGIEVICVSYFNTTYLGTTYTYSPTSFTSFTSTTKPVSDPSGSPGTWYQIAWLANQLFDATPGTNFQAALQWAIWKLTDAPTLPGPVPVPSNLVSAVDALIATAQSQTWTAGQFNDFVVYTPSGYVQGVSGPQQFIVKTPETSAIFMLLLTGAGIAAFTWRQRRRMLA